MAVQVLPPGGVVSMTAAAADRLVKGGNGDAALLYLHLLRRGGLFEAEAARKALGWTDARVQETYRALAGLGLVRPDADLSPASAPPEPEAPRTTPPPTSPGRWRGAASSPSWSGSWSGGWGRSSPPPI